VYNEETEDVVLPNWRQGAELHVSGCTLVSGKTKPKPLHTDSSLLAAMETDGIGTPATRAATIETLIKREYVVRDRKSLVPTEKGLALHFVVKGMDIADAELTGKWEAELARIERGEITPETFMDGIKEYTRAITTELLSCDKLFSHKRNGCACPKCKAGTMRLYPKVVRCDNADCALSVFRQIAGKTLSEEEVKDLLTKGRTPTLKGFKSKQGNPFSASVVLAPDFSTQLVLEGCENQQKAKRHG